MEFSYLIQIIVSMGIFAALCFLGEKLKKFISINSKKKSDSNDYFPEEEIMTLNQVHYLGIMLFIYIIIINLLFETYSPVSGGLLFINNLIDICLSITIIVTFYDSSNKSRILSIFIMPMASIASLVFGGNLLGFWDFIRIPVLLYVVIISYHEFLEFTNKNQLGKTDFASDKHYFYRPCPDNIFRKSESYQFPVNGFKCIYK